MNTQDFNVFSGLMVRTSLEMVDITYETVKRTWKERLFSWPWHPFQTTKTVQHATPKKEVYHMMDGTLVMHPATLHALKQAMENR